MSKTVTRRIALVGALFLSGSAPLWAADAVLTLTLKDHKFSPAEPTIPANTRVKVTIKNLDPTPAEFESHQFKAERLIPGGKEASLFIGPLKPGKYQFNDEYHEDVSKTYLIVK
ncbi:cupredoxin domain-containing protein [Tolumonas lignilytica]|uniref:cupredoxin domain-containing protein n=1 Tax=Tolumonas lignilytica TaxID=1283284 RepID=UPI00046597EE|nr:cupredoxin domain-containing protein [Tolumonas lignilytica]